MRERYQVHHGFNVVLGDDVEEDEKTAKKTFVTRDNVDEVVGRMTDGQVKGYVDRGYLSAVPGVHTDAVGASVETIEVVETSPTRAAAKAARGAR